MICKNLCINDQKKGSENFEKTAKVVRPIFCTICFNAIMDGSCVMIHVGGVPRFLYEPKTISFRTLFCVFPFQKCFGIQKKCEFFCHETFVNRQEIIQLLSSNMFSFLLIFGKQFLNCIICGRQRKTKIKKRIGREFASRSTFEKEIGIRVLTTKNCFKLVFSAF